MRSLPIAVIGACACKSGSRDVLNRAGVKSGKVVGFFGLNEPPSKVPKFVCRIPKATDADTLLAVQ
jgi:hypothetical protein